MTELRNYGAKLRGVLENERERAAHVAKVEKMLAAAPSDGAKKLGRVGKLRSLAKTLHADVRAAAAVAMTRQRVCVMVAMTRQRVRVMAWRRRSRRRRRRRARVDPGAAARAPPPIGGAAAAGVGRARRRVRRSAAVASWLVKRSRRSPRRALRSTI